MMRNNKKFTNTGDINKDFNIDINTQQTQARMKINTYNEIEQYNNDVTIQYSLLIYLVENGEYTNDNNIDLYELYHYNNLRDAIQAAYTIKLLMEQEDSQGKNNIEGYRIETTVKYKNNTAIEEATNVLEYFNSCEEIGLRKELNNKQQEIENLKAELKMYQDFVAKYGVTKQQIEEELQSMKGGE